MVSIKIGKQSGRSRLEAKFNVPHDSTMKIVIGDQTGMSLRQIDVLEREAGELASAIAQLQAEAQRISSAPGADAARAEADKVIAAANATVETKRFHGIDLGSLVSVAGAIGAAANPLLGAAFKVVELIAKIRG